MKNNKNMNSFYELSIPTCSYRMGVAQMGYGLLTVNQNGLANVSILWLPSRYACLNLYLMFVIVVILLIIYRTCFLSYLRNSPYFW